MRIMTMMMIILHTMSTSGNISSTTLPVGKKIMAMIMTVILIIKMQMVKMMMTAQTMSTSGNISTTTLPPWQQDHL